jgi:predicted small lipoprotein YifL
MLIFHRAIRAKNMRKIVLLLLLAPLLPACGLKAPLYLPEQKPAANPSAAATPASGAPADAKKTDRKSVV